MFYEREPDSDALNDNRFKCLQGMDVIKGNICFTKFY